MLLRRQNIYQKTVEPKAMVQLQDWDLGEGKTWVEATL